MSSEKKRYENTLKDLVGLNVQHHCELGPGGGEIATALQRKGKNVCAVEAPWEFDVRTAWARAAGINVYPGDFFTTNFADAIADKVECFSLVHCIAHFRFPPHLVLRNAYNKLEKGGYFYLSTVNGGSLDRVMKLFRGGALTEEVLEYADMGEEYRRYCNPSGRYMIWDSWMHVKEYRAYELEKIFRSCGFQIHKLFHRNNFRHWKQDLLCSVWPHLSEEIVIIGKKV